MKIKYTPGKWRLEGFCIKANRAFDSVITKCTDLDGKGLANGRLITAAPELLRLAYMERDRRLISFEPFRKKYGIGWEEIKDEREKVIAKAEEEK